MSAVARKLISTMIRLDFEGREDEFTSVDSLNPVKLAAVLCKRVENSPNTLWMD